MEWISVKDRLPESGVHVLLCCEMHRHGGEIAGKYVCDGYYAEANKIIAGGFPDECDCEYSEEDDEYYLREGWYEVIKNYVAVDRIGNANRKAYFFMDEDGEMFVRAGCWFSDMATFRERVKEVHAGTIHEKTYLAACDFAELVLEAGAFRSARPKGVIK